MNDRQKKVLSYIQQNQPVKLGDITKNLPQFTAATIRKDGTLTIFVANLIPIPSARAAPSCQEKGAIHSPSPDRRGI
jgi:hypothetical protein